MGKKYPLTKERKKEKKAKYTVVNSMNCMEI